MGFKVNNDSEWFEWYLSWSDKKIYWKVNYSNYKIRFLCSSATIVRLSTIVSNFTVKLPLFYASLIVDKFWILTNSHVFFFFSAVRGMKQEVSIRTKHGVEAKTYEGVSF